VLQGLLYGRKGYATGEVRQIRMGEDGA
jgi:hypothetical protein